MLRLRLAATLLFNVLLAVWVYYDARTRGARKPLFAAGLTLVWGPLGLGFWASDRPLADGERRAGGAGWTMARTFAIAWTVLLPTIVALVVPDIRDRSVVPGSLGGQFGVPLASLLVSLATWLPPLAIALGLGAMVRAPGPAEAGRPGVAPAKPPLTQAILIAGLVVFAAAKLFAAEPAGPDRVRWQHLSSSRGELPVPGRSTQQTGALGDVDGDRHVDIFAAEMAKWKEARAWIFYGEGRGHFETVEFAHGMGFHESASRRVSSLVESSPLTKLTAGSGQRTAVSEGFAASRQLTATASS